MLLYVLIIHDFVYMYNQRQHLQKNKQKEILWHALLFHVFIIHGVMYMNMRTQWHVSLNVEIKL